MSKPELKFSLSIRWWRSGMKNKIRDTHAKDLAAHGFERAAEMMAEGYTSGELCYEIDTENGSFEYSGWWEVK